MAFLSDERMAAVRSAYERGVAMKEIGDLYGLHRATVSNYAKRFVWRTPDSRILQVKLVKLRRQQRSERVTEELERRLHKRHANDWSLVRKLIRESVDNRDICQAQIAHHCAETLQLLHAAECNLRIMPSSDRIALSPTKRTAAKSPTALVEATRKHVGFDELCAAWDEATPTAKPGTRSQWKRVMRDLSLFLGHENAAAVTRDEVIRWKDHLLSEGYSSATIRSRFVGAPCSIFSVAQDALLINHNPFRNLRVPKTKPRFLRGKGFTDDEARKILLAALTVECHSGEPRCNQLFRRWGPWLCAFTGARIGEIAQLRKTDVEQDGEIYVLHLTPEAGSTKSGKGRRVPVHPQLLQLGFLQFVASQPTNYRFHGPRGGHLSGRSEIIGKWVRSIGVDDPGVHPNHGWRHRFKTLCRAQGIANEYHNAITGHANAAVGDGVYGEYPMSALFREICKLPWVRLPTPPDQSDTPLGNGKDLKKI